MKPTRATRTAPGLIFLLVGNSLAFPHLYRASFSQRPTTAFALSSTTPSTEIAEPTSNTSFWRARQDCWRPDVRDVEKISWGMPAKKKGTGSRGIPHRLNEEERRAFDQARRQGFLQVKGSSWRSQRRDAPLLNTYRSLMDALGRPAIILHKLNPSSGSTDSVDVLVVDISPLRFPNEFESIAREVKAVVANGMQIEGVVELEQLDLNEEDDETTDNLQSDSDDTLMMYETRPIYQIPPYCVKFNVSRQQGKEVGKLLAAVFGTVEEKAAASMKPKGVKPGKGRRSGGYGIG